MGIGKYERRKRGYSLEKQKAKMGVLMLLPSLIIISFIILYPLISSFVFAFMKKPLGSMSNDKFIGLKNFAYIFIQPLFWKSLLNSTILTFATVVLQTIFGMIIALLLNTSFKARGVIRGLFILPWATPAFVAAFAWSWMVDSQNGMINILLKQFHLVKEGIPWLMQTNTALFIVILAHIWKDIPWVIMIFLSGLQMVPVESREAAKVDGANIWKEFWYITIPSMKSIIVIAILLRVIWTFKYFDLVKLLTGGGPLNSTMTIPIMIYQQAFESNSLGRASALGVILFVILGVFSFFYFKVLSKDGEA